jgi:hypothetical protein
MGVVAMIGFLIALLINSSIVAVIAGFRSGEMGPGQWIVALSGGLVLNWLEAKALHAHLGAKGPSFDSTSGELVPKRATNLPAQADARAGFFYDRYGFRFAVTPTTIEMGSRLQGNTSIPLDWLREIEPLPTGAFMIRWVDPQRGPLSFKTNLGSRNGEAFRAIGDARTALNLGPVSQFAAGRFIGQRAAVREAERSARAERASRALADADDLGHGGQVAATLAAQSEAAEPDLQAGEPDHLHQMAGRQLVDAMLRHQRADASPSEQIEIDRRLAENEQAQLDLIDSLIAGDDRAPALPGSAAGSAPSQAPSATVDGYPQAVAGRTGFEGRMHETYVVLGRDEVSGGERFVRGEDGEPFSGTLDEVRAFFAKYFSDVEQEPRTYAVIARRMRQGGFEDVELGRGSR